MSRLPALRAADLDGRSHTIPDGLPPGPKVILLGFKRWHQVLLAMWEAQLRPLERSVRTLGVWRVTALPRSLTAARPIIDGGLRANARDPEHRRRILTAYVDLGELSASLGLADLDTVHALLLGPDGNVVWGASGKPTAETVRALSEVLAWTGPGS
jgi:hypothetical protein